MFLSTAQVAFQMNKSPKPKPVQELKSQLRTLMLS